MKHAIPTPTAWADVLSEFAAWMVAGNRPGGTVYLRTYQLRRFGNTTGLAPLEVERDDMVNYLGASKWSASTRRSARSTFRAFYGWLEATGRREDNPARHLPAASTPIGQPRPAPERAVKEGLSAVDTRVRLMVSLAAHAGLRCCEIALVNSADLVEDLYGWTLRVHGKGSKVRMVPLSRALALQLRALPAGWAFTGQINGHLSQSYVSKIISNALPDGWTAHTLRHRFASAAYAADSDIRAVQELLGHASVATTQIYTKVPDGALRRAVAAAAA